MFRDNKFDDNDTYRAELFCKNCRAKANVEIPRGITIAEYCKSHCCHNCGCNTCTIDISKELKGVQL